MACHYGAVEPCRRPSRTSEDGWTDVHLYLPQLCVCSKRRASRPGISLRGNRSNKRHAQYRPPGVTAMVTAMVTATAMVGLVAAAVTATAVLVVQCLQMGWQADLQHLSRLGSVHCSRAGGCTGHCSTSTARGLEPRPTQVGHMHHHQCCKARQDLAGSA